MRDNGVTSVLRALSILDVIAERGPMSLAELVATTDLPKSTLFRLLSTMCQARYLNYNAHGEYVLATKLWRIGTKAIDYATIHREITDALRALVEETSETAHFSIYEDGYALQVEKVECTQPIRAYTRIGGRSSAYATATGKALLAYQSPHEIQRVANLAEPHTSATVCDPAALVEQLRTVRKTGVAINRGEWRDGVWSVAACVFDHQGEVAGALGISGPQDRVAAELDRFASVVLRHARVLTESHGGFVSEHGTAA
jgi:IclR family KDG regulon transcriptional repressor